MAKASKDTKSTATSKVKGTKKPSKTPATSREIIEKAVKQGKVDVVRQLIDKFSRTQSSIFIEGQGCS